MQPIPMRSIPERPSQPATSNTVDRLFIGSEAYYGFRLFRPSVPLEEVWLLQRKNGNHIVARDTRDIPFPPLFDQQAITIYKFHNRATLKLPITLLRESGSPVDVVLNVTLTMEDPLNYLKCNLHEIGSTQMLEFVILDAVREPLSSQVLGEISLQVVSTSFKDLCSEPIVPLRQRLSKTDFSFCLKENPEFLEFGLHATVKVGDIQMSAAYEQLIKEATFALQHEVLQLKKGLAGTITNIEEQRACVRQLEERLQTSVGSLEKISVITPIITSLLGMVGNAAAAGVDPGYIIDNSIKQFISGLTEPSTATTSRSPSTTITPLSGLTFDTIGNRRIDGSPSSQSQNTSSIRLSHIQGLYTMAMTQKWVLNPPQHEVVEDIHISLSTNCSAVLKVPKNYPQEKPFVPEMTWNDDPISYAEVNRIVDAILYDRMNIEQQYDLCKIVSALAEYVIQRLAGNSL